MSGNTAVGAPTVLFLSSQNSFYDYAFSMSGTYNSRCAVTNTFWQLSSMKCALPYVPTAVPIAFAPTTCKPTIATYWTLVQTPCSNCGNTGVDHCDVSGYKNGYTKYQIPLFQNSAGNNLATTCVYNANQRLGGSSSVPNGITNIATLRQNCLNSGVGLEISPTNTTLNFLPRFPGVYKLNYTVADGCNPPKTVQVTVKAQCITQMTTPNFIKTATTVGYYCQGNPSSTSEEANGAFQVINLHTTFIGTSSLSVSSNPYMPTNPTGCAIPTTTTYSCKTAETHVNALKVYGITTGSTNQQSTTSQSNMQSCCKCLYGMSTINAQQQTLVVERQAQSGYQGFSGDNSVAMLAEEVSEEVVSQSVTPAVVVAPLGILLVASAVANMALVMRRRRSDLPT
jgi:hypothetical protein